MSWIVLFALAVLVGIGRRSRTGGTPAFPTRRQAAGEKSPDAELDDLLAAVRIESKPAARRRLLARIVAATYRERRQPAMQKLFFRFAAVHLNELPLAAPAATAGPGGRPSHLGTFKRLAVALEETGRYEEALRVCEQALQLGATDGTKGGFSGRIARLRKKMAPSAPVAETSPRVYSPSRFERL